MGSSLRWSDGGRRFILPLCLFVIVVVIASAVRAGWTAGFDRALLLALASSPPLIRVAQGFTLLGDTASRIAITGAGAIVLLGLRQWRRALALAAVIASGAALNSGIKLIVMRPRPALLPHLDHVTSYSFPSGHAANGAMMYLALALLVPPRWRTAALIGAGAMVLAIGMSRMMLAVHWPSDVAAGWCLGAGWILLWRNHLALRECG